MLIFITYWFDILIMNHAKEYMNNVYVVIKLVQNMTLSSISFKEKSFCLKDINAIFICVNEFDRL